MNINYFSLQIFMEKIKTQWLKGKDIDIQFYILFSYVIWSSKKIDVPDPTWFFFNSFLCIFS